MARRAAPGSVFFHKATQDVYYRDRVNGVDAWVRVGNIRDEGTGGIVGVNPQLNIGFGMGVVLSRTRFLNVLMNLGFNNGVDHVDRIRALVATHGLGFTQSVVAQRVRFLTAAKTLGFNQSVLLSIIQAAVADIAAGMAFGLSMSANVFTQSVESLVVNFDMGFSQARTDLFRTRAITASMALGFAQSTALSRIQQAAGNMALGFSMAALLTHTSTLKRFMAIGASDSSTWGGSFLKFFDSNYAAVANPATMPSSIVGCIAFSHDRKRVAVSTAAEVLVYDLSSNAPVLQTTLSGFVTSNAAQVAWSPDDSKLAVVNAATGVLRIYNATTWANITSPAPPTLSTALSVDWSPDNTRIAVGLSASPFLREYDASTMAAATAPATLPTHAITSVRYSPDGRYLAALGSSGDLKVYDRANSMAKLADPATMPTGNAGGRRSSIAWNPTGTRFVATTNGAPFLWSYTVSGTTIAKEANPATQPIAITSKGTAQAVNLAASMTVTLPSANQGDYLMAFFASADPTNRAFLSSITSPNFTWTRDTRGAVTIGPLGTQELWTADARAGANISNEVLTLNFSTIPTAGATIGAAVAAVLAVANVDVAAPKGTVQAVQNDSATSAIPSVPAVPVVATTDLVLGIYGNVDGHPNTVGSGYTQVVNVSSGNANLLIMSATGLSAGTATVTFGTSAPKNYAMAFSLKMAGVLPVGNSIGGVFTESGARYVGQSNGTPGLLKYTASGWVKDPDIPTQPGSSFLSIDASF